MKMKINPVPGLLLFCLAVITVPVLPELPERAVVVFIGTTVIVLTVLFWICSRYFWWLLCLLLGMGCGFANRVDIVSHRLPPSLENRDITFQARIISMPAVRDGFARFDVRPVHGELSQLPKGIRLSWREAPQLTPGDEWTFTVRLKRPRGFAAEGAFDYEAWIVRQGIQATGYVRRGERLNNSERAGQWLNRFRQSLQHWLQQSASLGSQGILVALLTGDKSGISTGQWQRFNLTGTTHLMVISGLHIGLMTTLGYWLMVIAGRFGLLPLRAIPLPVIAGIFGLLLAVFYSALAGFGIPVQRSLVMTTVALSGPLLGVRATSPLLWSLALAVVLAIDPLAFTSAGFWYSFLAVAALLVGLGARRQPRRRIDALWQPQWIVFLMLTPLLLMNGQPVSPLSPLINLIAIPFVGLLIVPLLLFAGALHAFFPVFGDKLLWLADCFTQWFQTFLETVEPLVPVVPEQASMGWPVILLALMAGLFMVSPVALRLRIFAPFLLLPWLFPKPKTPGEGTVSVTVLDIGQGLSVLLQTRGHTLVYDTGDRFTDSVTAADRSLLPTLAHRGIRSLDRVIVSHGDRDHSGGIGSLEKKYGTLNILAGSGIPDYQGNITYCRKGQQWQWDGVDFEVLAGGGYSKSNECSCVLKVTAGHQTVLLTGDISSRVERQMLSDDVLLKSDVLVAPHHGSKYSSSEAFLWEVQPEIIIFSTGYGNRFGHPSREAIDRSSAVGATLYNTASDGSLTFTLGNGELNVEAYRKQNDRYWW